MTVRVLVPDVRQSQVCDVRSPAVSVPADLAWHGVRHPRQHGAPKGAREGDHTVSTDTRNAPLDSPHDEVGKRPWLWRHNLTWRQQLVARRRVWIGPGDFPGPAPVRIGIA